MAKKSVSSSHVAGFVKGLKVNPMHGVMTFSVLEKRFVLPDKVTTFTSAIREAKMERKNVLILFKEMDGTDNEITGVFVSPKWSQVRAAAEGKSYDEVYELGIISTLVKHPGFRP